MNKKIILTSILALCMATPAMAEGEIANASGLLPNKSCDESTLGVTEGTANIEAIWTANTYSISYTCANGIHPIFMIPYVKDLNCTSTPTDPRCIYEEHAIYGLNFTFGLAACEEAGYEQTGWSCTRDNVANDTPTVYTLGQQLTPWDIPSDLTCTEIRVGNTITVDWYDRGVKQTVSAAAAECRYGDTAQDSKPLTLPSAPAARAGYTFSGWKLFDICTTLSTQNTCNMNSQCFWYIDENTNEGSCLNTNSSMNGCNENQANNSMIGPCSVNTQCQSMTNSTECSVHSDMCEYDSLGGCTSKGTTGDLSLLE